MRYSRLVGSALISVAVLVATLSALTVAAAPQTNAEQTVYVTRTGKKYHVAGCRYLRSSQREMNLKDAVAAGYTPCSVCNPPRLSAVGQESNRPASETDQASSNAVRAGTKSETPTSKTAATGQCQVGHERWAIKTSLPAGVNLASSQPTALEKLLALPNPQGVSHNDSRYETERIPAFDNDLKAKEGDLLTTTGWLYLVATEADCDYHIQISDKARTLDSPPAPDDNCLIVEAPKPDFVADANLSARVSQAREYIKAKLLRGSEPSTRGSVMQHAVCVQVTGQLFYDDAHVESNGQVELRGKREMHSRTPWELHPVIDFKIVQPSASACQF
jgi:hypothetical protein